MDDEGKFSKLPLSEKEDFYSHLTWKVIMMQITHTITCRVCKELKINNLGEHHDLYV